MILVSRESRVDLTHAVSAATFPLFSKTISLSPLHSSLCSVQKPHTRFFHNFICFCNFDSVLLMESWSYVPEEEEHLFPGEMDFSFDALMINRKALVEWGNKVPCNFEKNGFISQGDAAKNMDFVHLGFPNIFQKTFHGSQPLEPSNRVLDSNSMGEEESESKHSSFPLESRSHNSFLIDLNLGRLADCKGASSDKIAKGELSLTSIHPATTAKRARTCSYPTHTPVCQVYGCNLDLSSSKEYHKRHKVCDVHSKTAKVIVNGTEQRFCQQCSRFHMLAEFDDGKRSCRRRLAGHNERRRKPQFDYMSNKQHKILRSYEGTKYLGSTIQKRPQFAFQDLYRSGFYDLGKYEKVSHNGHMKLEEETCAPQLAAAPITHGQELSRFSISDSALSLLSAQSQNPSGNPLDSSSTCHGICLHYSDDQVLERPLAINSVDKYALNKSFPLNSNEAGHALQFQVQKDNNCQPSHLLNAKCQFSSENGATTVDLLQLSSHLQRVEHQRNSFQVKRE